MKKDDIDRDILNNSKYIILYFNNQGKLVTNLMLEKLLYFLEAIYMVVTKEDYLFYNDFYAWNFGPVSDIVYNKYREFGNLPIELDEKINIPECNKKYIDILFDLFGSFTAYQLVNLSHMDGSPWSDIYKKYEDIPKDVIIEKLETKKWFDSIIEKKYDE